MASTSAKPLEVREPEVERVEAPQLPAWPLASPKGEEKPTRVVTKLAGSVPA